MARLTGFKRFLCAATVTVWALGGSASPAEPLRLVTDLNSDLSDAKAPGFDIEVLRQVFAAMRQDASFETLPYNRLWRMVVDGERDGIFSTPRTSERERICSFPDEAVVQTRLAFFVRTADAEKLKLSSFDNLIGHDVAVNEAVPGLSEQPFVPPELLKALREHRNMVETSSGFEGLRMLAAGRVDYAVISLRLGVRDIARMALSGKIEPLVSPSVMEFGTYVCFTKGHVSPSFVDAFSQALKQFKQTEAYRAIYRKYYS